MAFACGSNPMALEAIPADAMPARRQWRSVSPGLAYLGVIFIPPALFYFGLASSHTAGTFLVCLALLACRFARLYGADGSRGAPVLGDRGVVFAFGLVGLHLVIAATFEPLAPLRAAASLVPLGLLLLGGGTLASMLFAVPARRLHQGLRLCLLLLCLLAVLGVMGIAPPSSLAWRKPVFPFSEPSHFALAYVPLLMYGAVTTNGARRAAFLLLCVACTVLIQSLTLLAGFALVALATIRWHVMLLGLVLMGAVGSQLDLSYYIERLDFSGDRTNLSNLIYLQGWQMVGESWERSSGFGLGFQQLGTVPTEVPAAQILRAIREGDDANPFDGSFVFAKFGSEFGIFAFVLVAMYLWVAARSLRRLREAARDRSRMTPVGILAHCLIVSYFIELFVRSNGYFTPAALLLITAFGLLARERRSALSRTTLPVISPNAT
jgi:hypothetical protein